VLPGRHGVRQARTCAEFEAIAPMSTARGDSISLGRVGRYLLAGAIVFASILGATYLGFSLAMRTSWSDQQLRSLNRSYLDVGDHIPDYEVFDVSTRQKTTLRSLMGNRPALLLFVSTTCGPCQAMSDYWDRKVLSTLKSEIAVFALFDDSDWFSDSTRSHSNHPFKNAKVLTIDRDAYKDFDGITTTPTLVAIASDGRVKLVATGFSRKVGSDVLNDVS
jgi:thiol-disulfide isomerase/thioredoxin